MAAGPRATSVVEHRLRIAAPPETVFGFFTDPARFVQWMGAHATLDPRPGGVCRVVFRPTQGRVESVLADPHAVPSAEREVVMSGRFLVVDRPHRLAFSWGWEQEPLAVPPESTLVEVSLEPDGDETVVTLTHRRIPPAALEFHRNGWEHYLERLWSAAAGTDPGHDPWESVRPAAPTSTPHHSAR